jgi:purine-nucleoside phosphorylase
MHPTDLKTLQASEYLFKKIGLPESARINSSIILGSGLSAVTAILTSKQEIPFQSIPYFPESTVPGHPGQFVFGKIDDQYICIIQGRLHYYEGHDMQTVTLPVRILAALGTKNLIITNAAGALNEEFHPGDFVLIRDHIGLFLPNPLIDYNKKHLEPRFPDLTDAYSKRLRQIAVNCGEELGLEMKEGIYVGVSGPSYETPSEVALLKSLGADMVGMSTVPEVIVANHLSMNCLGISVITNMAAGLSQSPLHHEEVLTVSNKIQKPIGRFLRMLCRNL